MPPTQNPAILKLTLPLPLNQLDGKEFERLCLWLVNREGFSDVQHLGELGADNSRDIVANKDGKRWVFQCKNVNHFSLAEALHELKKIKALPQDQKPDVLTFIIRCAVTAKTREKIERECSASFRCCLLAGTELDERLKRYPDILQEFFGLTSGSPLFKPDYAGRVDNFKLEYLGTAQHPVPFGGRDADFDELDNWLSDLKSPPYLLLLAPAGRGKSALLTRWLERLDGEQRRYVVFFPVSIRFRTNQAVVVFGNLISSLARVHSEQPPSFTNATTDELQALFHEYLRRPLPAKQEVLLVLDGIDEAADWKPGADLFPLQPLPGLKVLLSARVPPDDSCASQLQSQLGWDNWPLLYRTLHLAPLTRTGLGGALESMGFPVKRLARRVDIVSELFRLTDGDPLLARYYVADLQAKVISGSRRLRPGDLATLRPGYKGYFERWWEEQKQLWGTVQAEREAMTRKVLEVLACALGPITNDDLLEITGLTKSNLRSILRLIVRFVVGDATENGYTFGHSRFAEFFYEDEIGPTERRAIEEEFLRWGQRRIAALLQGEADSSTVSKYLIRYFGAHLDRAGCAVEQYVPLTSPAWFECWQALEGTNAGFLNDVDRLWRSVEQANTRSSTKQSEYAYLGQELRCALITASVHTLSAHVPPELSAALVKAGLWSPTQALTHVRQNPNLVYRLKGLALLLPLLPNSIKAEVVTEAFDLFIAETPWSVLPDLMPHFSEQLQERAIWTAKRNRWEHYWLETLSLVAPQLSESLASRIAKKLDDLTYPDYRMEALLTLLPIIPLKDRPGMLSEVLNLLSHVDLFKHLKAIPKLFSYVDEDRRNRLIKRGLGIARETESEDRAMAFALMLPCLTGNSKQHATEEALNASLKSFDQSEITDNLIEIAKGLDEPYWPALARLINEAPTLRFWHIEKILEEIGPYVPTAFWPQLLTTLDPFVWHNVTTSIAPYYPREQLPKLARKLKAYEKEDNLEALVAFANYATNPHHDRFVRQAEACADRFLEVQTGNIGYVAAEQLCILASGVEEPNRTRLLRKALLASRIISDEAKRVKAITSYVDHLPDKHFAAALEYCREIKTAASEQVEFLQKVAPKLSGEQAREALSLTPSFRDVSHRATCVAAIVPRLPTEIGPQIIEEIISAADPYELEEVVRELDRALSEAHALQALRKAERVGEPDMYVNVLESAGHLLSETSALKELRVAVAIKDDVERATALTNLIPQLPQQARLDGYRKALEAVSSEEKYAVRPRDCLKRLAPVIPHKFLSEILKATKYLRSDYDAIEVFAALAPRLSRHDWIDMLTVIGNMDLNEQRKALIAIGANVPHALAKRVLGMARKLDRPRSCVLASLLPSLDDDLQRGALREAVTTLQHEYGNDAVIAIRLLDPYVEGADFDKLFEIANTMRDKSERAEALNVLVPRLSEARRARFLRDELSAALAATNESERQIRLSFVGKYLTEFPPSELYPLVAKVFRRFGTTTRQELLAAATPFVPAIHKLGGSEAVVQCFEAIRECGSRWP